MSNCNCNFKNIIDGSGQLQRYLKELDPSYAPIDGRSIEDILVFAKRYAAQIRFYDVPELPPGQGEDAKKISWKEFFRRDMAVIASSVARTNADDFKNEFDEVREKLQYITTPEVYTALFAPITGMVKKIDRWYTIAIPQNPLYSDLELAINSNLKEQVRKIISYKDGYKYVDPKVDLNIDLSGLENEDVWGINEPIEPDSTIYKGNTTEEKLIYASLFVEDIFHSFYSFLSELVEHSSKYLHFALEMYPDHQPHMALFIAFLEIFRRAQQQLNGVTGRMLDFYFRDVLHLEMKPSVPDKVHVVFELAKDVSEYDIAEGTALSAGKDNSGIEQLYKTKGDLVVNQAKVKELKTIFIEKSGTSKDDVVQTIYARPVANSLDGKGEKFTEAYPKWPALGEGRPLKEMPGNICERLEAVKKLAVRDDQAKIGFAIASPQLLMQGGKRLVTLKLEGAESLLDRHEELLKENNQGLFEFWFTGPKGWFSVSSVMNENQWEGLLVSGVFNTVDVVTESSYYVDKKTGTINIYLPVSEEQVIGYDPKLHSDYSFPTSLPVMQVFLKPQFKLKAGYFQSLKASGLSLRVKVGSIFPDSKKLEEMIKEGIVDIANFQPDGLSEIIIQTETGLVKPGKTFDPFTVFPAVGKSFYIGSQEVFNKPLGKLAVFINKTSDTSIQVNTTAAIVPNAGNGEYGVSILQARSWKKLNTSTGTDFTGFELKQNILYVNSGQISNDNPKIKPFELSRIPVEDISEWTPGLEKGFIKISNLIQTESDIQARQNRAIEFEIKEVYLSYDSELSPLDHSIDEFYHVYPFGNIQTYYEAEITETREIGTRLENLISEESLIPEESLLPEKKILAISGIQIDRLLLDKEKGYLLVKTDKLLPQFTYENLVKKDAEAEPEKKAETSNQDIIQATKLLYNASGVRNILEGGDNQYSGAVQEEGLLFIGLENSKPLQTVTILFQFADGSAKDEDNDPPAIHWSYLTNNEWRPMKDESIISDGTYGFQTTGIVKIEIPEDATTNNTVITGGLHWLCASVTQDSDRIPMLVNIVAQAALTEFEDNNNDQTHFDSALAAGSITKLQTKVAEVSKVEQPFGSFDGKHKEIGSEYYTRVSERLRHKNRAITPWDFEHLVLERFPSIYKVKCISHTDPNCLCREGKPSGEQGNANTEKVCCGPQIAPGHVLIIPIANMKNRNAINPLQPKTPRRTLLDIESYLKGLTSPFVKVYAKNAVFEQIITTFKVKFYEGYDKGYYLKKLNEEIVRFLTPWAFDENADVRFGQKIYASSIINFIEERNYVDFITDFMMFLCCNECCPEKVSINERTEQNDNGVENYENILDKIKNCCGMVKFLREEGKYSGEIVAEPCTPRSILVSYPRHLIFPYEEPVTPSPCEVRKEAKEKEAKNLINDNGKKD